MKKILVPILLLATILASCSSPNEKITKDTKISKTITIRADYKIPKDIKELEDNSANIVKVKFLQNKTIGKDGSSISEIEILTSYKGNLEKGSKVDISEPWYLSDGKYVAVENYIALDKGQEYTIFLGEKDKDTYPLSSMGYGKFGGSLKEDQAVQADFNILGEVQKFDFISENTEEVKNYQLIKEQVAGKYK
ncbi:TPA: hypothetical protein O5N12_000742 [Listeria monocytogenes]|uniref:hypothetical protein n=1 Tax=Listeria monocytogenes TaxID=1639 RepID=UPI001C29D62E|nr:hypothetical protein [Listeria monocytogenes]MCD1670609.1 hypothetical protein [Listeria monocytogenes]MCD1707644.1 hypothetical protein [Listeria monocytogenes]MCD1714101.1 hypothetical protein [Listeria monocytogenes]MCD1728108.1 hypothetical protein [Listeria monocytogenes]MCD1839270.1 hypothetical protein [Listeria monocytogenes]